MSRVVDYGSHSGIVKFSPNGERVVFAGTDEEVRLRDVASGQLLGQPVKPESPVLALALSRDGRTILTGGEDGVARLWDVTTGQPIAPPMRHPNWIMSVALSPDGRTVVTGCRDGSAQRWNAATGRLLGQPLVHTGGAWSVAFSPDGQKILTGGQDNTARLWDAGTAQPLGQPIIASERCESVAFSPDGRTILTGCQDGTARLWDAATAQPIGPPMPHSSGVFCAVFSPDGKTIVTGTNHSARLWDAGTGQPIGPQMPHSSLKTVAFSPDGGGVLTIDHATVRRWEAPPPLPDDLPRLTAWVEATTGLAIDERGMIQVLDRAGWMERRRRLEQPGGPPPRDLVLRRDPILFGGNPAARGDSWKERGEWDRAEAAYIEAVRARPLNGVVRDALARLQAERGRIDRAATTLAEGVSLLPDEPDLCRHLRVALLASGDRAGWRRAIAARLESPGETISSWTANELALACSLVPEATTDPELPARLAEAALGKGPELNRDMYLSTFGAALYRAGRFDEAIRRLEEGIGIQGGEGLPSALAFLAMAHHRLGHRDQARGWLDRLRDHQPSTAPARFWDELEIRLLRIEAEAVIQYDPIFPADPFALSGNRAMPRASPVIREGEPPCEPSADAGSHGGSAAPTSPSHAHNARKKTSTPERSLFPRRVRVLRRNAHEPYKTRNRPDRGLWGSSIVLDFEPIPRPDVVRSHFPIESIIQPTCRNNIMIAYEIRMFSGSMPITRPTCARLMVTLTYGNSKVPIIQPTRGNLIRIRRCAESRHSGIGQRCARFACSSIAPADDRQMALVTRDRAGKSARTPGVRRQMLRPGFP